MARAITIVVTLIAAGLFGSAVPLARLFDAFSPMITGLSIMVAAVFVRASATNKILSVEEPLDHVRRHVASPSPLDRPTRTAPSSIENLRRVSNVGDGRSWPDAK